QPATLCYRLVGLRTTSHIGFVAYANTRFVLRSEEEVRRLRVLSLLHLIHFPTAATGTGFAAADEDSRTHITGKVYSTPLGTLMPRCSYCDAREELARALVSIVRILR